MVSFLYKTNPNNSTFMKWNIGCAGFGYKEWKNVFYPDKMAENKWFNFYTSNFNTVEINETFHRFPTEEKLSDWYSKSPENFSFANKVPKFITHFKQLIDAEVLLTDFYTVCKSGLKEKLGPFLFLFPPKFNFTQQRLQQLISILDNNFINVVEFRHSSWWNEEVYTQFAKYKIIFCGISHPDLPDDIIVGGPLIYYRFHGVPSLYYSAYKEDALKSFADDITGIPQLKEVNCFFNNTASPAAVENAIFLKNYCTKTIHEHLQVL
jgi:uncharacterized protein YecE (DUF72 family)